MRKQTFSTKRIFGILTIMLLLGILGAKAANFPTRGSIVIIPSEINDVYTLTPSSNGTLQLQSYSSTYYKDFFFTDADCKEVFQPKVFYHSSGGFVYYYIMEKGKTYYFSMRNNTVQYEFSMVVSMNTSTAAPYPTFVYPERSGQSMPIYHISNAPEMQLIFNNKAMTFENALLEYENNDGETKSAELDILYIEYDNSWRIFVKNVIDQLKGEIKNHSVMKIVLTNVQANGAKPTGGFAEGDDIVFPYEYVSQTSCIQAVWPNPFLSYWPKGDPAGIAVLTFDGELKPMSQQKFLEYGLYAGDDFESEDGMIPMPTPELKIEGKTITIDFTGVVYETEKEVMTMVISGVEDIYNMPFVYGGNNGINQFMPYEELGHVTLVYELTPGTGQSLQGTDEIELWIDNDAWAHIEIEGFSFECGEDTEVVAIESCTREADPFDPGKYTLIYVPIPEVAKSCENVTMSALIRSMDGTDYDMSASYVNEADTNGVVGIDAESGETPVYNLQGIRVKSGKLPAGVYIIGGKKRIVR